MRLSTTVLLALIAVPAWASDQPSAPPPPPEVAPPQPPVAAPAGLTGTLAALDEKYGFRDVKLDTPMSEVRGLEGPPLAAGGLTYYTRPSDSMRLGRHRLTRIAYGFYKSRLAMIVVQTPNRESSDALQQALEVQYGPGQKTGFRVLGWASQRVLMTFTLNPDGSAILGIQSRAIGDEMKAADRASAENADL